MSEIIKYTPVYYTEVNGWDSAEMRASKTGDYIKVSDLDRDALDSAVGALKSEIENDEHLRPGGFYSSQKQHIAHLTQLRDIAEGK